MKPLISIFKGRRGIGGDGDGLGMIVAFAMRDHLHEFRGARWNVFTCIALHADMHGIAYPSIETICAETGYATQAVTKAVGELTQLVIADCRVLAAWRERDDAGRFTGSTRYLIFPTTSELAILSQGAKGVTLAAQIATLHASQFSEEPHFDFATSGKVKNEENPSTSNEKPDSNGQPASSLSVRETGRLWSNLLVSGVPRGHNGSAGDGLRELEAEFPDDGKTAGLLVEALQAANTKRQNGGAIGSAYGWVAAYCRNKLAERARQPEGASVAPYIAKIRRE